MRGYSIPMRRGILVHSFISFLPTITPGKYNREADSKQVSLLRGSILLSLAGSDLPLTPPSLYISHMGWKTRSHVILEVWELYSFLSHQETGEVQVSAQKAAPLKNSFPRIDLDMEWDCSRVLPM